MEADEVEQALRKVNQTIDELNAQLHPPPADPALRQQREAELQGVEQTRATLRQALNNLPETSEAAPELKMAKSTPSRKNRPRK